MANSTALKTAGGNREAVPRRGERNEGHAVRDRSAARRTTSRRPPARQEERPRSTRRSRDGTVGHPASRNVAIVTALAELLAADLSALGLVAIMLDRVQFGEHTAKIVKSPASPELTNSNQRSGPSFPVVRHLLGLRDTPNSLGSSPRCDGCVRRC